jgi:hypothetical protein
MRLPLPGRKSCNVVLESHQQHSHLICVEIPHIDHNDPNRCDCPRIFRLVISSKYQKLRDLINSREFLPWNLTYIRQPTCLVPLMSCWNTSAELHISHHQSVLRQLISWQERNLKGKFSNSFFSLALLKSNWAIIEGEQVLSQVIAIVITRLIIKSFQ